MRPRRRARRSRPILVLTADQARTAYLACRDAEAFRRWHACTRCARCRSARAGACVRHVRDLNLAGGCARPGGHVLYPSHGGGRDER